MNIISMNKFNTDFHFCLLNLHTSDTVFISIEVNQSLIIFLSCIHNRRYTVTLVTVTSSMGVDRNKGTLIAMNLTFSLP